MKIEYVSLKRLDSFWEALDEVAKERKYLLFTKAPEKSSTKNFVSEVIKNDWTQFVALEGEKVIGWCDILPGGREGIEHVGHVGMGVIKSHRRKGIGEQLLKAAIEDAFAKKIFRIELEVFSSNSGAVALYKKLGFREEGIKRSARYIDGKYDDIIVMGLLENERKDVKEN